MTQPRATDQENYPGDREDGLRWYSLSVHYWDSNVVVGQVSGSPGDNVDVWAAGYDFAYAVANAIRFVESQGHCVDGFIINL